MTAREYLSQINKLDKMIENKYAEILRLQAMSVSISVVTGSERVQTSMNHDKIDKAVVKLLSAVEEYEKMLDQYIDKRNAITKMIDDIEDANYYDVLFRRYVEHKRLEVIAHEMNYDVRHIGRLHNQALEVFEKQYEYILCP